MANPVQSADAIEGDSIRYRQVNENKLSLAITPFEPIFTQENVDLSDPEAEPSPTKVRFVQAYIINYLRRPEEYIFIENMDEDFDIEFEPVDSPPFLREYEVKVSLNKSDGTIKKAEFQKKPKEGEDNYRDPVNEKNTFNERTSFPIEADCLEIFYPVCKMLNEEVSTLWMRDNIHWWGDLVSSGKCVMWNPRVENTGTEEEPFYEMFFGIGTVNGKLINVQQEGQVLIDQEEPELEMIVLHVDINPDGTIADAWQEIALVSNMTNFTFDPVEKDSVPTHVDVLLGTILGKKVCMYHTANINLTPYVWFQETKPNGEYTFGEPPFINHWKIKLN